MESERMMGFCVVLFVMLAIGLLATSVSGNEINDIPCSEALQDLLPCKDYLMGSGPDQPPLDCCQNADSLYKQATTTPIRRALCDCLKNAAISMGVNFDRAKKLAPSCHITVPFPIDPKIDCNSISLGRLMMERFK